MADNQDQLLTLISSMLAAMAASTDADDFCEQLATKVLRDYRVEASYLATLDRDGRITMVGSWGYPEDRRSPDDRPSYWTPMAITDTIREGQILFFPTWADYIERYPHLVHRAGPGASFLCVPFSINGTRAGGLGITFADVLDTPLLTTKLWEIFANAGDLMISKGWAGQVFTTPVPAGRGGPAPQMNQADQLTERELKILSLIAQGMTNPAIAAQLKYSESTVRQETIQIYRLLGVTCRADAVIAGRTLGIVPAETPAPQAD